MTVTFHDTKRVATDEDLLRAEQEIGRRLPAEYKQHLRKFNGGQPEPAGFDIVWNGQDWTEGWETNSVHYFLAIYDGETSNFLDYYRDFSDRIPADTVPIAYDEGGNLILLGVEGKNEGKVFFWLQEYESDDEPNYSNVGFVARNFEKFLNSLHERKE